MKNRREILKASAAFMGVLSAFGLTGGNALAQKGTSAPRTTAPRADARTLKLIFEDAMKTHDMHKTLPRFEHNISPEQRTALLRVTPDDLKVLSNLRAKLPPDILAGGDGVIIH
jgi:hypothetical protein